MKILTPPLDPLPPQGRGVAAQCALLLSSMGTGVAAQYV